MHDTRATRLSEVLKDLKGVNLLAFAGAPQLTAEMQQTRALSLDERLVGAVAWRARRVV